MYNSYQQYFDGVQKIFDNIKDNEMDKIEEVSQKFAECIANDGLVHMYGSGHSRIGVEEMFPRYGSYPGFHPMVELSTTFYQNVTGSNGIRQSMFIENVEGLGQRILQNFKIEEKDCFMLFTTSGTGNVVIDIAIEAKKKGCFVVGVTSIPNCSSATSKHSTGQKLDDVCDIILDNSTPIGDAIVHIDDFPYPVSPGSTVGNVLIDNLIKARVAKLLVDKKQPPKVITHAHYLGKEESGKLFEEVLDDYDRRIKR